MANGKQRSKAKDKAILSQTRHACTAKCARKTSMARTKRSGWAQLDSTADLGRHQVKLGRVGDLGPAILVLDLRPGSWESGSGAWGL